MLVESFSGVRGVVDQDLFSETAKNYAAAFYQTLKPKKIVIGRDTRPSGEQFYDEMISCLPCDIINVGELPTPLIQQAVRAFNADAGIIITASHNEPYWNGFKFLDNSGAVVAPTVMDSIIKAYQQGDAAKGVLKQHAKALAERSIEEKQEEAIIAYIQFAKNIIKQDHLTSKVLIDPNGGAAVVGKQILEQFGLQVESVNMEAGGFNRTVEPNSESLRYLLNPLEKSNADFAAGFDCDADRVEILLPSGQLLSGNHLIALLGQQMLQDTKDQVVVVNDASSNLIKETVAQHNAIVKEVQVGEVNVVQEMISQKSIIGGEGSSSGAIIAPSTCRDGILTILALASLLQETKQSLQKLVDALPSYSYFKEKVDVEGVSLEGLWEMLKNQYKTHTIIDNGVSGSLKILVDDNTFVWFRVSKTEGAVLRIIVDAKDQAKAEALLQEAQMIVDTARK